MAWGKRGKRKKKTKKKKMMLMGEAAAAAAAAAAVAAAAAEKEGVTANFLKAVEARFPILAQTGQSDLAAKGGELVGRPFPNLL
jgi:hypothetical protein